MVFGQHSEHLAPAGKTLQFEQPDADHPPSACAARQDASDLFAAQHIILQRKLFGWDRIERCRQRGARDFLEPEGKRDMRSLAIVRDDIHLTQMDRATQVERALLGDLAIAEGNPAQQFEHGLNRTQGRLLGRLRVMEGQEIAVPRAPQTAQPAALPDLADQRPQIANGLAANRIPAKQIARQGRFDEIDEDDGFGSDLRHCRAVAECQLPDPRACATGPESNAQSANHRRRSRTWRESQSPMNLIKVQSCSLLNRPECSKKSCNTVEVTRSPSRAIRCEVPAISQNTTARGCRRFDVSIYRR